MKDIEIKFSYFSYFLMSSRELFIDEINSLQRVLVPEVSQLAKPHPDLSLSLAKIRINFNECDNDRKKIK